MSSFRPHPSDPKLYVWCVNGREITLSCPPGAEWMDESKQCADVARRQSAHSSDLSAPGGSEAGSELQEQGDASSLEGEQEHGHGQQAGEPNSANLLEEEQEEELELDGGHEEHDAYSHQMDSAHEQGPRVGLHSSGHLVGDQEQVEGGHESLLEHGH